MLTGIRLQAHPTEKQKKTISQWIGCARFIWYAKYEEEKYLLTFSKRYLNVGTYPDSNRTYSQGQFEMASATLT